MLCNAKDSIACHSHGTIGLECGDSTIEDTIIAIRADQTWVLAKPRLICRKKGNRSVISGNGDWIIPRCVKFAFRGVQQMSSEMSYGAYGYDLSRVTSRPKVASPKDKVFKGRR